MNSSLPPYYASTELPANASVASAPHCPGWHGLPLSTLTVLIPALYSVICALGTVANALAVCVLARGGSGSRRTVANTFMLNLCVSDLLFLLSLPLWAVYYSRGYHWPFGWLACKVCGGILNLNLYASIFFITCMSVDRYLAIVHPLRSQSARDPRRARLACALAWVLACASSAPTLVMRATHPHPVSGVEACVILYPDERWFLGLVLMKMVLGFLLPMAVISSCYCAIGRHLLGDSGLMGGGVRRPSDRGPGKSPEPQERPPTPSCTGPASGPAFGSSCRGPQHPLHAPGRGLERVLWTVAAVVLAFFLCWFPFHCVTLLDILRDRGLVEGCWVEWATRTLTPLTLCLGFSNSAINPVLYCFVGNHFRGRLGGLCKDLCACARAPYGEAGSHKRGSFSTRLSSFSRKLSDLKDLAIVDSPGHP